MQVPADQHRSKVHDTGLSTFDLKLSQCLLKRKINISREDVHSLVRKHFLLELDLVDSRCLGMMDSTDHSN